MDGWGEPIGLFATNRWVTGETWYPAGAVIRMLDRLQAFFQSVMQDRPKAVFAPDDPRIAVAAL